MKVRVMYEGGGLWRWWVVAGNGAVVGAATTASPKTRAVKQAEQVAGPLRLTVDLID